MTKPKTSPKRIQTDTSNDNSCFMIAEALLTRQGGICWRMYDCIQWTNKVCGNICQINRRDGDQGVGSDSGIGYIWNGKVYTCTARPHGFTYEVLTPLCQPLFCKGYHVYMNNVFTSRNYLRDRCMWNTGGLLTGCNAAFQGCPPQGRWWSAFISRQCTLLHHMIW